MPPNECVSVTANAIPTIFILAFLCLDLFQKQCRRRSILRTNFACAFPVEEVLCYLRVSHDLARRNESIHYRGM